MIKVDNSVRRKRYNKVYYQTKVKPFRKIVYKGEPEELFKCFNCGFSHRKNQFIKRPLSLGYSMRAGSIYFSQEKIKSFPQETQSLLYYKYLDVLKIFANKSLNLLRNCIQWNLITKEFIINSLELNDILFTQKVNFQEKPQFVNIQQSKFIENSQISNKSLYNLKPMEVFRL